MPLRSTRLSLSALAILLTVAFANAKVDAQRVARPAKAGAGAEASQVKRQAQRSSRRVGKRDAQIEHRVRKGANAGEQVLRGFHAARSFRRFFKVDLVEQEGKEPRARLNLKKVAEEIQKSGANVSVEQVKRAWAQFQKGEAYLARNNLGYRPPYQSLRVGALGPDRKHVTRLSLADPGPEHRTITALEPQILKNGVIVHHEFINRENTHVQPYRPPDPLQGKLVTYGVAAEAPVSVYHGLPNFPKGLRAAINHPRKGKQLRRNPKQLREALRTPATSVVDVAKSRFNDGAAELKVRLAPQQMKYASAMVQFMVEVNDQIRTHSRHPDQILSAQFNLNEPIINDLGSGRPKVIRNPKSIARLSLQIMARAKQVSEKEGLPNAWRKWAPDGAFPEPGTRVGFIELLGGLKPGTDSNGKARTYSERQEKNALVKGTKTLVGMVARAHELGFETYISAGMEQSHMKWATYAGVDGVGIGTALHERTTEAGRSIMGRLSPEKVKEALAVRDAAEKSALGKGARELYRLSFAKSRGKLRGKSAARYKALLSAMKQLDESRVAEILKQ